MIPIKYSQNFISDNSLSLSLQIVDLTDINPDDLVIEIGSGAGALTKYLIQKTKRLITIEKDPQFTSNPIDFMEYELPQESFKIVGNIPFALTADIVRKLLSSSYLESAYLIMQKETGDKFVSGTLQSILYQIDFEIKNLLFIERRHFRPQPKVDACLISFTRKPIPEITNSKFKDFVTYKYVHSDWKNKVTQLNIQQWIELFNKEYDSKFNGAYQKLLDQQKKLQKRHRTDI